MRMNLLANVMMAAILFTSMGWAQAANTAPLSPSQAVLENWNDIGRRQER